MRCRIRLETKKIYSLTRHFPFAKDEFSLDEDAEDELPEELSVDFIEEEGEAFPCDLYADGLRYTEKKKPEFSTTLEADGTLEKEEDGTLAVFYGDPYISGVEGSSTTVRLHPSGIVTITSTGQWTSCLIFEKHNRILCDYGAAGGVYSVTLHTHRLENLVTENGGSLLIDYTVEIHGSVSERNILELSVLPL